MRADERGRAWIVVVLLFIFMMINAADKAVIGIAAVPMMQGMQRGPRQFGLAGSSFFLLFAISSIATGFLVGRSASWWPCRSSTGSSCVGPGIGPSARSASSGSFGAHCGLPLAAKGR
jgi:hypothetical protein